MKKLYSKPEIMFENFSMSVNVAAGCENINRNPTSGVCAYIIPADEFDPEKHVFTGKIGACIVKEESGDYNGICYDTPSETYNLFSSM